jgi:hypothetical protein
MPRILYRHIYLLTNRRREFAPDHYRRRFLLKNEQIKGKEVET